MELSAAKNETDYKIMSISRLRFVPCAALVFLFTLSSSLSTGRWQGLRLHIPCSPSTLVQIKHFVFKTHGNTTKHHISSSTRLRSNIVYSLGGTRILLIPQLADIGERSKVYVAHTNSPCQFLFRDYFSRNCQICMHTYSGLCVVYTAIQGDRNPETHARESRGGFTARPHSPTCPCTQRRLQRLCSGPKSE